jgi:hypothetical protein
VIGFQKRLVVDDQHTTLKKTIDPEYATLQVNFLDSSDKPIKASQQAHDA